MKMNRDVTAGARELNRDRPPDTAAGAGYKGPSVGEISHEEERIATRRPGQRLDRLKLKPVPASDF
jgi:hypothetical protein